MRAWAFGCLCALVLGVHSAAWAVEIRCEANRITLLSDIPITFEIELADDPGETSRGLMFRRALDQGAGMLFLFEPPQRLAFWMKNTFIPLDMIFFDAKGQVINIAANTQPLTETTHLSDGIARAVLEINAGLSEKYGIHPGTQAVHTAFLDAVAPYRCAGH